MALFGQLAEMPLSEVLPLAARREGALEVVLPYRPPLYLAFAKGRLQAVREGQSDGPTPNPFEARFLLLEALQAREGAFQFIPGPVAPHLDWEIERLVLQHSHLDDLEQYRSLLPAPETRFVQGPAASEEPPGGLLQAFWQQAAPLLARPQSVAGLAQRLALPEAQVAYCLYRLRQAGLVQVARPEAPPEPGLLGRLVSGVRRLLGGRS